MNSRSPKSLKRFSSVLRLQKDRAAREKEKKEREEEKGGFWSLMLMYERIRYILAHTFFDISFKTVSTKKTHSLLPQSPFEGPRTSLGVRLRRSSCSVGTKMERYRTGA